MINLVCGEPSDAFFFLCIDLLCRLGGESIFLTEISDYCSKFLCSKTGHWSASEMTFISYVDLEGLPDFYFSTEMGRPCKSFNPRFSC